MSTNYIAKTGREGGIAPADKEHPSAQVAKEKQEKVRRYPKLSEYLNATLDAVERRDKSEWLTIKKSQVKAQSYYDGMMWGTVTDDLKWEPSRSSEDPRFIQPKDNQYKIHVDKLNMEMCRSFLELDVEANDKTDSAKEEAAKVVKHRIEVNRKRMMTASFMQAENMSLLKKTITFRYTFMDSEGGIKSRSIDYGEESAEGSSLLVCAVCKMPAGADTPCENCGNTRRTQIQAPATSKPYVKGHETKATGQPRTIHVDPLAVTIELAARDGIPSSKTLLWRQMVDRCVLEEAYPDRHIPSTNKRDGYDGYRSTIRPSNSDAWDDGEDEFKGGDQFEQIAYDLIWLDRVVYASYISGEAQELMGGKSLPAGTKLGEKFPDGMCVARVGKTILDVYPENKNKKWTMCVYGYREHALHGSGTNALLHNQDTHNDIQAAILANILTNAAVREFFNPEKISGDELPTLGTACPVTNLSEKESIMGQVYAKAEGSPLAPDVYSFREANMGAAQEGAGTSSLNAAGTSAQTDALGTATGIAAMRDQAVGRMGPNLMLKASMEEEHAYQIIEMEKAEMPDEFWQRMMGKGVVSQGNISYTAKGVQAFLDSDIRSDFTIKAVPGSWMPQTDQQERADFQGFTQVAAQLLPLPPSPERDEMLALAAKTFKQPLQINKWDATEREAARRLELIAQVAEKMARNGAPPTEEAAVEVLRLTPGAAISFELDDHAAHQDFLADWFVSDEGVHANPLLKKVVEIRHKEHRTGVVYQVGEQKLDAAMSDAPVKALMEQEQSHQMDIAKQQQQEQMAQAQALQQQEQAREEEQSQQGQLLDIAKYAADKSAEEDRLAHQAEEADKARVHEVGLEAMRGVQAESQD